MRASRSMLLLVALGFGCGEEPVERTTQFGGDRPVTLGVPDGFTEGTRYPLVLVLHGYGASGFVQQAYFGVKARQTSGEAFVLAPDGLTDAGGRQFWNADERCCDFDGTNPDDVAYLGGLVDEVAETWPVDRDAIFIMGHSNGGFMAYRMACERADLFAGILALAGSAVTTPCAPARPVSVLHVHGDADDAVPFATAAPSVAAWAEYNGCTGSSTPGSALDLDASLDGSETNTTTTSGCPPDGAADLWHIRGGGHLPSFTGAFEPNAWAWLSAHRR